MPIYEFTCPVCAHQFDEIVPMGTTDKACPKCGREAKKSVGSYKFAAHGLENGHIAVGRKLTGKDSATATGTETATETKAGASCGAGCACH